MKFKCFEVQNFKGISKIHLDFEAKPSGGIYTLVGLNESGKTTILEALDYLSGGYSPSDMEGLQAFDASKTNIDPRDLIPMAKRGNFNEIIKVAADYTIEAVDKEAIKKFLSDELNFVLTTELDKMLVQRIHQFEYSKLKSSDATTYWGINPEGYYRSTGRSKKNSIIKLRSQEPTRADWIKLIIFIKTLMPVTIYYPNFLFEFPDKIYLEDEMESVGDAAQRDKTYRVVLQDVLDALTNPVDLNKHVLDRAKSDSRHDKQALESVLLQMDAHLSKTVFGNWNRIFNRSVGSRRIVTDCDVDENGRWFLRLRLRDNNNYYEISERSMGFRWFFSFMLLTQYRGFRKDSPKNVLFLLDEPASNLHPSAQQQLLSSFDKIENCGIIYTTHSHHMINPGWLENTYVVKNTGLDYNAEDEYTASETNITLERYRVFADKNPTETTYFQPILDVLDYRAGNLENVPNAVLVEGKNDFYTLVYFRDKIGIGPHLAFMPGNGSGSLDAVIRLYVGWGHRFVILLDSDTAGKTQKDRYMETFGPVVEDRIVTLSDIDISWAKLSLESLIEIPDRLTLQVLEYSSDTKYNKTHFNRAIQAAYLTSLTAPLSALTLGNFQSVFNYCADRFSHDPLVR